MNNTTIQTENIVLNKNRIIDIVEIDNEFQHEVVKNCINTNEIRNQIRIEIEFIIVVVVENWTLLKKSFSINRENILHCVDTPKGFLKSIGYLNVNYKEKNNYNREKSPETRHTILKNKQGYIIYGSAIILVGKECCLNLK